MGEADDSTEKKNKKTVMKVASAGWKPEVVSKYCSEDYLIHFGTADLDRDHLMEFMGSIHHALPDLRYKVNDIIAEGDKVVTRWVALGTHKRAFQGVLPTQQTVQFSGITISRLKNGKIVEDWEEVDQLNFSQQFGAFPQESM
ncbi:steroid delta-isomerase-like uncharacterized protein [Methanohalophilus levihalophilus]|uniref:ester cyclase n=1 Tax=Methanohalophilus levihalophilus TaxID=1431282 RepID=UPI001AEB36D0|nr:ester cyclase [Methanohalophilus levihalophilus]MBP2029724.1 steroid delta-isomerase-like uncharacterized protein [Methanohalophilus levihalophilus]